MQSVVLSLKRKDWDSSKLTCDMWSMVLSTVSYQALYIGKRELILVSREKTEGLQA